jgi:hypothetical protein
MNIAITIATIGRLMKKVEIIDQFVFRLIWSAVTCHRFGHRRPVAAVLRSVVPASFH